MVEKGKIYAVLTGDLVKSSRLSPSQSAMAMKRIIRAADELTTVFPGLVTGKLDTFRHDSWQLLLARPELSLVAALFLRTSLKMMSDAGSKFDSRLAIGIGPVEYVDHNRISNSRGPAFSLSGKGLDASGERRMVFSCQGKSNQGLLCIGDALLPLLDALVQDWTAVESSAVYGALQGWTQERISAEWPGLKSGAAKPSRQAVGKSLQRAHWRLIEPVLTWAGRRIRQHVELANNQ